MMRIEYVPLEARAIVNSTYSSNPLDLSRVRQMGNHWPTSSPGPASIESKRVVFLYLAGSSLRDLKPSYMGMRWCSMVHMLKFVPELLT